MRAIQAVLITVVALASSKALAASYDCSKASTYSEKAICNNPELSNLDDELSIAYKEAMGSAAEQKASYIRAMQREWLKLRNACKEEQCILNAIMGRISELKANSVSAPASKERVAEVEVENQTQISNEPAKVENPAETRKPVSEEVSAPQAQNPNRRVVDLEKAYKFYMCSSLLSSLNQLVLKTKGASNEEFVKLGIEFSVAGIAYSNTDIYYMITPTYTEQYDRSFRQPGGWPTEKWMTQELSKCKKLFLDNKNYLSSNAGKARDEYWAAIDALM